MYAWNEDRLRLHEQSQPNGILQVTCWIHLLLDFQVQFLKVVADCCLLKYLLYSIQITLNKQCKSSKAFMTPAHMNPLVKLIGLQRQYLFDEQQGSHEGEIFSGKAYIFWWLSSSVLPERNGKGHWKGGKCAATLNDTESAQSELKE